MFKYYCKVLAQLRLPYKFCGGDMPGTSFFTFSRCEPLTIKRTLSNIYKFILEHICVSKNLVILLSFRRLRCLVINPSRGTLARSGSLGEFLLEGLAIIYYTEVKHRYRRDQKQAQFWFQVVAQ